MAGLRTVALLAVLALVPGCAVWMGTRVPAELRSASLGRPTPSYYCYDCHGYRYLDPYYDWCPGHGFRYAWDRHPETVRVYRDRYVRIKEQNPTFGRYRYRADYREQRRYREPRDYELWRGGSGASKSPTPAGVKVREQDRHEPGKTSEPKKRRDRERPSRPPRTSRPADVRPDPTGGA
jgi:hypothetical protein